MEFGLDHAPLVVFTTLAPMAAASFIVLAYGFIVGKPDAPTAKRLDRWTALPAAFMALGMAAAFFHLANPVNALLVFSGLGSSPLSNELAVTVAFAAVALVYWILGLVGKLPAHGGARTAFLVVLAAGSLVYALFCGLAYMMDTIPTWNGPATVLSMLGCALLGGAALGSAVWALAKAPLPRRASLMVTVLGAVGIALVLVGFAMEGVLLSAAANVWGPFTNLAPQLWVGTAVFAVCGIAACVLTFFSGRSANAGSKGAAEVSLADSKAVVAVVLAVAGILMARFAFYGLFAGIAL